MGSAAALRQLLAGKHIVLGGGAHDALSARIVEQTGYPVCVATEGADVIGSTPEDFGRVIRDDIERWQRVIKQTGIKVEPS